MATTAHHRRTADEQLPLVLERYRLGHVIGRGGMSVVHRGVDTCTGQPVAIKLLAPHLSHEPESRRRLLTEARAAARLPHRNIVRMLSWGTQDDGAVVLVMELVDGESLATRLRRAPLPAEEALAIARQVAGALAFAHQHGVIHRDVKPHNVLLGRDGSVKLADFGIARSVDATSHTTTGLVMGSAPYVAPELLRGEPASARSDLYALGVTLFQMLTGRLPFQATTAAETLTRRLMEEPPRLRTLLPIAPTWLENAVAALLAREPSGRPASAPAAMELLGGNNRPDTAALPQWSWKGEGAASTAVTQAIPRLRPSRARMARRASPVTSAAPQVPPPAATTAIATWLSHRWAAVALALTSLAFLLVAVASATSPPSSSAAVAPAAGQKIPQPASEPTIAAATPTEQPATPEPTATAAPPSPTSIGVAAASAPPAPRAPVEVSQRPAKGKGKRD